MGNSATAAKGHAAQTSCCTIWSKSPDTRLGDSVEEKPSGPPAAAICGYWFQNSLAVEHKLGAREARRSLGIPAPSEGSLAWAVVDAETRTLEWVLGEVSEAKVVYYDSVSEAKVEQATSSSKGSTWNVRGRDPLVVCELDEVEVEGWRLVTSITVNGVTLERTFAARLNNLPVYLTLSEASSLGWEKQCLLACLLEVDRTTQLQQQEGQSPPSKSSPKRSSLHRPRSISFVSANGLAAKRERLSERLIAG